MAVMQFSKEEVREVLRLLAGILQLGNVEFITAGGAQVSFKTGGVPPSCCPLPCCFPQRKSNRSAILTVWAFIFSLKQSYTA